MNAELEKWIDENGLQFDQIGGYAEVLRSSRHCKYPSPQYVSVDALSELFDGKVLVPVDALNSVMELAGVALVYQPFGTKDRQHFDTLIRVAASQEQGK